MDFAYLERANKIANAVDEHLMKGGTGDNAAVLFKKINDAVQNDKNFVDLLRGKDSAGGKTQQEWVDKFTDDLRDEIADAGMASVPSFRARAYEQARLYAVSTHIRTFCAHAAILIPWLFEVILVKHHFNPYRVVYIMAFGLFYHLVNLSYVLATGRLVYPV